MEDLGEEGARVPGNASQLALSLQPGQLPSANMENTENQPNKQNRNQTSQF